MEIVLNWAFRHPILVLVVAVAAFVLWLAAPVTWRDGEGSAAEESESLLDWYGLLGGWYGGLWHSVVAWGTRRR